MPDCSAAHPQPPGPRKTPHRSERLPVESQKTPTSRSIRRPPVHRVEAARRKGSVVESVEATGRTADEAIENALDELGLERDEVTIEVLAQAGEGRPARVRVTPLEGIELEYDDDDDDYDDDDEDDDEEDEDVIVPLGMVPVMTMHQSKGLEFPIVFVGHMGENPRSGFITVLT